MKEIEWTETALDEETRGGSGSGDQWKGNRVEVTRVLQVPRPAGVMHIQALASGFVVSGRPLQNQVGPGLVSTGPSGRIDPAV